MKNELHMIKSDAPVWLATIHKAEQRKLKKPTSENFN
jgi:hypothetical protein